MTDHNHARREVQSGNDLVTGSTEPFQPTCFSVTVPQIVATVADPQLRLHVNMRQETGSANRWMTVGTITDTGTPSDAKRLLLWLRFAPGALQAEGVDHHAGVDDCVVLHVVVEDDVYFVGLLG